MMMIILMYVDGFVLESHSAVCQTWGLDFEQVYSISIVAFWLGEVGNKDI